MTELDTKNELNMGCNLSKKCTKALDTGYHLMKDISMEKRTPKSSNSSAANPGSESLKDFQDHLAKLGRKELSLVQKKLNYLCLEFDPYNDTELTDEESNIIEEYELSDYVGNPFAFTNIVLQMLDMLEAEIKSRSH